MQTLPRPALVAFALVIAASASYTVKEGDTLSAIASRTGVPVSRLVAANDLADPDHIVVGQRLSLGGEAQPGPADAVHEVRAGETVSGLAVRYRTTVREIARASRLDDPGRIQQGQRLVIPDVGAGVQAAAAGSREDIAGLIDRVAGSYGWNPAFVKALAWQESGWNPQIVSHAGAVGVMQVLPSTGHFVSGELVGRTLDLADPADNVEAGVAFLDYLWQLTGGDAERTLAGYYQGLASVRRHGMAEDTKRYVNNVLELRDRY